MSKEMADAIKKHQEEEERLAVLEKDFFAALVPISEFVKKHGSVPLDDWRECCVTFHIKEIDKANANGDTLLIENPVLSIKEIIA